MTISVIVKIEDEVAKLNCFFKVVICSLVLANANI